MAAEAPKVVVQGSGDDKSKTFVVADEDHTLGNAVRHVLMRDKDVDFCGYSIPHPSEAVVNIRLQTRETPASDVLSAALTTLADMCDHVVETFDAATKEFDPSLVEEAEGGEEGEEA